jgi:hypothetical protein
MNPKEFKRAKELSVPEVIAALELDGERHGDEFLVYNPHRQDNKLGSFSINLETGIWADFAVRGAKGDLIALWQYVREVESAHEAVKQMLIEVGEEDPEDFSETRTPLTSEKVRAFRSTYERPAPAPVEWTLVMPVPLGPDVPARPLTLVHPTLGTPTHAHEYRTKKGQLLGVNARWDSQEERKTFQPYFLWRNMTGRFEWRWAGIKGAVERPLFRLPALAHPDVECVWLVEGELTAEAGQEMAPVGTAVVSWFGGTAQAKNVDVSPLRGYPITLIPDRDSQKDNAGNLFPLEHQVGMAAMLVLAQKLVDQGNSVEIVYYDVEDDEEGWDLTNALDDGWDEDDVVRMVKNQASEFAGQVKPKTEKKARSVNNKKDNHEGYLDPSTFGSRKRMCRIPVSEFPDVLPTNKLNDVYTNLAKIYHEYGVTCSLDKMTGDVSAVHAATGEVVEDNKITSWMATSFMPTHNWAKHHLSVAQSNSCHPAVDWVLSRPWDGKSRINDLFGTLTIGVDDDPARTPTDPKLAHILVFRWLISAVALLFKGVDPRSVRTTAAQGAIVLVGKESIHKTKWVDSLAPGLTCGVNGVDLTLRDHVVASTSAWIVEIAEIASSKREKDADNIKAFVTKYEDIYRRAYGTKNEKVPRRTVYVGTSNIQDILHEDSGTRRWWVLTVTAVNYEHGIDMQQLWAEILTLFRRGERWWLDEAERARLAASNENHRPKSSVGDIVESKLDWANKSAYAWTKTDPVYFDVFNKAPSRSDADAVRAMFRRENLPERKDRHKVAEFLAPPLKK